MNITQSLTLSAVRPHRLLMAAALAFVLALLLAACGGGGVVPTPGVQGLRPLSADFSSRKAVAYSPFRSANRDTETITAAMIREDLALLKTGGFTLLRVFDSSDAVSRLLLQVISDDKLDFKVMLGAYIATEDSSRVNAAGLAANQAYNKAEVDRAVALATAFKSLVLSVSVGNETMVVWSFVPNTPSTIAGYIKSVRDRITQPVTTDDNWAFFAKNASEKNDPRAVLEAVDFVSMHSYPLLDTVPPAVANWDYQQQAAAAGPARATAMMDAAVASAKTEYAAVRAHLDSVGLKTMPIVIGETGWKAEPSNGEFNRAHPVNQKMYLDRLALWSAAGKTGAGPASIVYFEAFDEPWKKSDDKWGLFTVARKARYMVQGLYLSSLWDAGSYTAADAVYMPTITSSTVNAKRYTLYADAVTTDEAVASNLQWFGYDSPPNAFTGEGADAALAAEGTHFLEIQPAPANASAYGWGVLATNNNSADLSQFGASGKLNLSIKTSYPGKLMIGFITTGTDGKDANVSRPISNSNADGYGFVNDGLWHQVSIPISALTAGQPTVNLGKVTFPVVISDIYGSTGNTAAKGDKTKIFVDGIFWSR